MKVAKLPWQQSLPVGTATSAAFEESAGTAGKDALTEAALVVMATAGLLTAEASWNAVSESSTRGAPLFNASVRGVGQP